MGISSLSFLAIAAIAVPVHGQSPITTARPAEPDISSPVLGGVGFGLTGFFLGAWLGANSHCVGEDCRLEGAFYGAAVGGTAGMALGVHLGNRSRGNFGLDILTGAGVWAGGIVIGSATHWQGNAALFVLAGIPVVQLITTISVERNVGRQRDREYEARPSVSIIPRKDGAALSVAIPFPRIR
jgi:hypothetical protein